MTDQIHSKSHGEQSAGSPAWTNCPQGALRQYSRHQRGKIVRRRVITATGIAATCCLAIASLTLLPGWLGADTVKQLPVYGGLSCTQVEGDMDAYFASRLDNDYRARVAQHLHDCPRCKRIYQQHAEELQIELAQSEAPLAERTWLPGRHGLTDVLAMNSR